MEFLAVIIGIGIGYALYRKKRESRDEDYEENYEEDYGEEARFESRDSGYTTRSLSYEEPRSGDSGAERREIEEAVRAGERALDSLQEARKQLDSARAWGIYDLVGGGLISSMIKHSKIDNANQWMDQANRDLRRFAKELRDVDSEDLQIDTGSLVSMLDIFCDNFFSDILVQQKINDSRARIDVLADRIEAAVQALRQRAVTLYP
jgi:hypothetical protein